MFRMLVEIWMVKSHSDEVSDANKEHAIIQQRKVSLCYNVTKNLAKLCFSSSVL